MARIQPTTIAPTMYATRAGHARRGRSGPGSITRAQKSRPVKKNIACSMSWIVW